MVIKSPSPPPKNPPCIPYGNCTPFGYFEYKDISKGLASRYPSALTSRTLLHGGKRIWQKRNEPRFCESFPAKLLRKTESALYSHILYFPYLESSVLRTEARKRTIVRLVRIRILLEKSSDFVQETQPKNRIAVFTKIRSYASRRSEFWRKCEFRNLAGILGRS